jgi:circadian clock protein KaiC
MNNKVTIERLVTDVPGLDNLLGGGLPESSFNILAGAPGTGKTTLAHQLMFSLARPDYRALFFTVMGEPALKMLRYQQQFSFFDQAKVNQSIRYVNLADDLLRGDYDSVMSHIAREVQICAPRLVFVDSFRSIVQVERDRIQGATDLQRFVQQLVQHMTSWQATTFLIGEYSLSEVTESNPIFTVADGILWLAQSLNRNSMVRKIQAVKMRGQAHAPGLHMFQITGDGLTIFPRPILPAARAKGDAGQPFPADQRLGVGVPELDQMLGGGLPAGYSLLVVGPSGCGKTFLATEFLAEGGRQREPGIMASFEMSPNQMISRKLHRLVSDGLVQILDNRHLDLSIDETLYDLTCMIRKMGAKRLVIDSLSGIEMALAPEFRDDYRESLYRMVAGLTATGVTVLMTAEMEDRYTDLCFSAYGNAFLADAIVMQRYIEIGGQFKRVMAVMKVRGSAHSKQIRFFEIAGDHIQIGSELSQYEGILSGRPTQHSSGFDETR